MLQVIREGESVNPFMATKNSVETLHEYLNGYINKYLEDVTSILNATKKKQNYDSKRYYDEIMIILQSILTYWIMVRSIKEFALEVSPEVTDIEGPEGEIYKKINEFFENIYSIYKDIEDNTDNIYAKAASIIDAILSNLYLRPWR